MIAIDRHHIHQESLPWRAGATRARGSILLRIGDADARTLAGQHAMWMMANLATRLVETVDLLVIDAPAVPVLSPAVAPFAGPRDNLRDALIASAQAIGTSVRVEPPTGQAFAFTIEYGATPKETNGCCVSANGWVGALSKGDRLPRTADSNPIGAYAAACLAIGEAFKALVDADTERVDRIHDLAVNLWTMESSNFADARIGAADNPSWHGANIGDVHVVGSGAVANAIHHAWLALPDLDGVVVPVDRSDKPLKETNLNRYALSTRSELRRDKALVLRDRLRSAHRLKVLPRTKGWNALRSDPGSELDERDDDARRIAANERRGRFAVVLSCVDRDQDRGDVQETLPRDLFQGSTLEILARCRRFDLATAESACAKCFTRPEEHIEVDDEVAARLLKMDREGRDAYARERDIDPGKLEAWFQERCATLTAKQLHSLRAKSTDHEEFSVSFVSMMSGLLVVGDHLKHILGAPTRASGSYETRYYFTTNALNVVPLPAEERCSCRTTALRRAWATKWRNNA